MHIDPDLKKWFDQMPGWWGCKDQKSVFQYANENYAKGHDLPHHLDVIGRTDFDIPCGTVNCAEIFREQDATVVRTQKTLRILDIHPFARGQWGIYIFTKSPWRDAQKNVVGTIFHGVDISNAYSIALSTQLAKCTGNVQNSFMLTDPATPAAHTDNVSLSPRESEVLFLTLRGKTAKLIAQVLQISHRTVAAYLISLENKFKVQSKNELIDKAIAGGYMLQIPLSLFSQQLSIVLASE